VNQIVARRKGQVTPDKALTFLGRNLAETDHPAPKSQLLRLRRPDYCWVTQPNTTDSLLSYAAFLLVSAGTGCTQKPLSLARSFGAHTIRFLTVDRNLKPNWLRNGSWTSL
jgi:hypothetical protein